MFYILTAVQKKNPHSGIYKVKLKRFVLVKTTCRSTTAQRECIIASPLKGWLPERAVTLRYSALPILLENQDTNNIVQAN